MESCSVIAYTDRVLRSATCDSSVLQGWFSEHEVEHQIRSFTTLTDANCF